MYITLRKVGDVSETPWGFHKGFGIAAVGFGTEFCNFFRCDQHQQGFVPFITRLSIFCMFDGAEVFCAPGKTHAINIWKWGAHSIQYPPSGAEVEILPEDWVNIMVAYVLDPWVTSYQHPWLWQCEIILLERIKPYSYYYTHNQYAKDDTI